MQLQGSFTGGIDLPTVVGGYRVETAPAEVGPDGATRNESATVVTNYGRDSVTVTRSGAAYVNDAVDRYELDPQTGGAFGEGTVAQDYDGSVYVSITNVQGDCITTTLRSTGQTVDVTTVAGPDPSAAR